MLPKDVIMRGACHRVAFSANNPGGTTLLPLRFGPRELDRVVQSSVRGNYLRPNSYRCETTALGYPQGTNLYRVTYPTFPGSNTSEVQTGCVAFGPGVFWDLPRVDDQLYNTALNRLNEKTRGTLDLTLAVSQAGSTARMLNATKRAEDMAKAKFRPTSKWRQLTNGVSSAWLEFIYGWKPLMQDIYDAASEATYVATGNMQFDGSARKRLDSVGNIGFDFQYYGRASAPLVAEHKQLARIDIVLANDDQSFARWGSVNPASVTWENVPYSFLVDWIYDVSSYLRAMETAMLYNNRFQSGYVVRSFITEGTYHIKTDRSVGGSFGSTQYYSVDAKGWFKQTHHSREVLSQYPLPRLPSFNTELSVPRLLNLAALLGARIKKFVPKTK